MMQFRSAAVLYNPAAGGGLQHAVRRVGEAAEALREHVAEVRLAPTTESVRADELARRAAAEGCDLIAPCGGDGTINETIQGMVGSSATLLPLPAGTANVLAWETGLPVDPVAAARAMPGLLRREIALGLAEFPATGARRYFLLMCGAGVDAHAVYDLNIGLKRRAGILAYFWSGFLQLFGRFERLAVVIDDETVEGTLAVVSKSRLYGGKLVLTPHAHLEADAFDVVCFRSSSPLVYTGYLAGVLTQTLDRFRGVRRRRAREVEMRGVGDVSRVYVQVDGELAGRLPVKIRLGPETIPILLPPAYLRGDG